jgi:fructose-1,6-bisphosphatase/inositol monophosphatase family enzyme
MPEITELLPPIRELHARIRDAVVVACETSALEELSSVSEETEEDTIFAIDRVSEDVLVAFCRDEVASIAPIVLIAEGVAGGKIVLPEGTPEADAIWQVIVDPIDGTRGLMYQKRSAWILTGVAHNRGPDTNLQDIELAVQTEIPLVKQHLSDEAWAMRGQGAHAERYNRLSGESTPLHLQPSSATTLSQGFATVARFFPSTRAILAAIDDEIALRLLGPVEPGKAQYFEDQYICSGGQFYELMAGHDRFIADLRPITESVIAAKGLQLGLASHPYDVCTELIARELGVIITDERGNPLSVPLDVTTPVTWVGYANHHLRELVEPVLQAVLRERGLLPN